MIPKRKLIKKFRAKKSLLSQQQSNQISPSTLLQKLKSVIPSHKQQAITILANLHVVIPQMTQPQFIRQLINILYQNNNLMVYETLFALTNLCELQPGLVRSLFINGFDKALVQLNSTDKQLLKPILIFFITVAEHIPAKYQYLVEGVLGSLSVDHLKHNAELVLEFLFRMLIGQGSSPQSSTCNKIKLSPEMIKHIASIFTNTTNMIEKSYALSLLAMSVLGQQNNTNTTDLASSAQISDAFEHYLYEMLVCIDLEKQYKMNFPSSKKSGESIKNHSTQDCMQEEQQSNLKKKDNCQEQILEHQQQQLDEQATTNKTKQQNLQERKAIKEKMDVFKNTVEGIEIMLEFMLNVLELNDEHDGGNGSEGEQEECGSDQDDDGFQDMHEEAQGQNQGQNQGQGQGNAKQLNIESGTTFSLSSLKAPISVFLSKNMSILPKFLSLSCTIVPGVENVVYLFYHLLMHIDKQLLKTKNQQQIIQMAQLVQLSLSNLFKSVLPTANLQGFNSVKQQQSTEAMGNQSSNSNSNITSEEYETLVQCLEVGLKVLLKNKAAGVNPEFLIQFSESFMTSSQTLSSVKHIQVLKPSWILMLELYSIVFNPEKNKKYVITPQQNFRIGSVLKKLLIQIIYQELEQLRCQVLDTLFDVYSNEQFDEAFVQLQFKNLLEMVLQKAPKISKSKTKSNKRTKFVDQVLKDVKRFLDYKKKMIKGF